MSSTKGKLFRLLSNALLSQARVCAVERIGAFVQIELDAVEGARPGDKMQILLPSDDVRTYTPIVGSRPRLLAYVHGDTPGPRWANTVKVNDVLTYKGPDRCIDLPPGPVTIVGDETSVATAIGYAIARPGLVTGLIEGEAPFDDLRCFARGDYEAIAAAVPSVGTVAITGGSALVQGVRDALRRRARAAKTKAYWAPGRVALD